MKHQSTFTNDHSNDKKKRKRALWSLQSRCTLAQCTTVTLHVLRTSDGCSGAAFKLVFHYCLLWTEYSFVFVLFLNLHVHQPRTVRVIRKRTVQRCHPPPLHNVVAFVQSCNFMHDVCLPGTRLQQATEMSMITEAPTLLHCRRSQLTSHIQDSSRISSRWVHVQTHIYFIPMNEFNKRQWTLDHAQRAKKSGKQHSAWLHAAFKCTVNYNQLPWM